MKNHMINMDSFGSDCPANWEDIANFLNKIIRQYEQNENDEQELSEMINNLWESYCSGDLPDAPKPSYYTTYVFCAEDDVPADSPDYQQAVIDIDCDPWCMMVCYDTDEAKKYISQFKTGVTTIEGKPHMVHVMTFYYETRAIDELGQYSICIERGLCKN